MKLSYETDKAIMFSAGFKGSIEEYAMMWLNLSNNVREHKELLKLSNNSDNDIFLICEDGFEKDTRRYLESLKLTIYKEEAVTVVMPYAEYDTDDEFEWEILKIADY